MNVPFSTAHNCLFSISALGLPCWAASRLRLFLRSRQLGCSVEHAGLVRGDHVLNVNECVVTTVLLEELEGLDNEVAEVLALPLGVVDAVTNVEVLGLEQVHDGQDLAVVWHEGLTDGIGAEDESLEDVKGDSNDLGVARVERSCERVRSKNEALDVLNLNIVTYS